MKKTTRFIILVSIFLVSSFVFVSVKPRYKVIEIQVSDIKDLEQTITESVLYIKKSSCPYCIKLDKKLNELVFNPFNSEEKAIYSIDLEQITKTKEYDQVIKKFGVKTVPSLSKVSSKGIKPIKKIE